MDAAIGNARLQITSEVVKTPGTLEHPLIGDNAVSGTTQYSTNFPTTENPISEGGVWHHTPNVWKNIATSNGHASGTQLNGGPSLYNDSYAYLSGFGSNYTVDATTWVSPSFNPNISGDTNEVEILLRATDSSGSATTYECNYSVAGSYAEIGRWNGPFGNFTGFSHIDHPFTGPLKTGYDFRATISGNVITTYMNENDGAGWRQLASVTDTALSSGQPGIGMWSTGTQAPLFGFSSYTATALSPPPTTPAPIALRVSEDAYQGDAQFIVRVDGAQVGGTMTASAAHSSGDSNVFILNGNWATGSPQVSIQFLNDAYGGSAATDRNLYVDSIAYNGQTDSGTTAALYSAGTRTFTVGSGVATASGPADTLTAHLSEDAYRGDALFQLLVDGKVVTTPQSVTTLHSSGNWQDVSFSGNFGAGNHTVGIRFTNDAYGGSATTDRNLYVNGIDVNGTHYGSGVTTLLSNGTANFAFSTAA